MRQRHGSPGSFAAWAGEEITIANRGVPVARLVPLPAEGTTRKLVFFPGQMTIPGDFDATLPADILDAVEGKVSRTQTKGKTKLPSRSKSTPRQ